MKVKRALVSVSNKAGLDTLVKGLVDLGVEIISTGGTARYLREAGLPITPVSAVTGFPEIMDGRVKTLHPAIHGGILADRGRPSHLKAIAELGIKPIDLVVVNLYPFEQVTSQRGVTEEDAIENIDIGGPSMVRAAAKNFSGVGIVSDPADYELVLAELQKTGGELSTETRRRLAVKAFHHTSHYDAAIATWLGEQAEDFPPYLMIDLVKVDDLRYGENPHQRAAWYSEVDAAGALAAAAVTQLHGAKLSFNNLLDFESARRCLDEFTLPACVIVKHNNPCGVAVAENGLVAYEKALSCDPVSAFGGVIVINRPIDVALARSLSENFIEVLWAPAYAGDALEVLQQKKDVRILAGSRLDGCAGFDMKRISGGMLVQDYDCEADERDTMRVVSERHPTESEWGDLLFGWKVAKHVKSNAIVLAKDLMTVGVGAGQMSRVDSARLAVQRARHPLAGCAVASDAFFPFPDALQVCADAGATSAIHPGGSKRDQESLDLANERGMAMVLTGRRHFRH